MELEREVVARNLVLHLREECRLGVKPRDLVLVLVGHQLEQIARDRVGKPGLARRLRGLGGLHLIDQRPVARRVVGVLIGGEELDPPRTVSSNDCDSRRASLAASGAGFTSASTEAASNAARRPNWNAARFIAHRLAVQLDRLSIDSAESGSAPS